MEPLKFLKERIEEYNANEFVNELFNASKYLGILEAKILGYQFNSILIPLLHKREAVSSMYIEGTQTTISDVLEDEINQNAAINKVRIEVNNHTSAIIYATDYLKTENFSHKFIQELHRIMLNGIVSKNKEHTLGRYKTENNKIVNSYGTTVFIPPSHTETKKYMDELIDYMNNNNDGVNPLIKAAIIHSQFESIHPFDDGNGRVGRLLITLYLYKAKVINVPFFYISEAISQDKSVYYSKLTDTRVNNYDEWIKFFLKKCIVQSMNHINYIDSLNELYKSTKLTLQEKINSPKYDMIIDCLFTHPILSSSYLAERINVSKGQAKRYLDTLEEVNILSGNDRKRNRLYYFVDLLDLARRNN